MTAFQYFGALINSWTKTSSILPPSSGKTSAFPPYIMRSFVTDCPGSINQSIYPLQQY